MARNTTLVKLLDDLRFETRTSLNPAHNAEHRARQVKALQREQERLWDEHDWPHLRVTRQALVEAGQRYYALPEDMSVERLDGIELYTNGGWHPLEPGIEAEQLSAWNSDLDERSWPPRRWQIHEDGSIEIWPVPDTNGNATTLEGAIRYIGIRNLRPLVADGDRADLDDRLIVLNVAAEMLAASGAKDAKLKLEKAQLIETRLTSQLKPRRKIQMFQTGVRSRPSSRMVITQYRPAG